MKILQSNKGYRYSLDAFLLVSFAEDTFSLEIPEKKSARGERKAKKIIDLGTGNGIIPLCLSSKHKNLQIVGIEIQEKLADLARKNVRENRLEKEITIIRGDIKKITSLFPRESFDLVLSNPPYRKLKSGRINPHPEKAIARHELELTLEELLKASVYLLKDLACLKLIYLPARLQELLKLMDKFSLKADYLRFVHSRKEKEASFALVSARKNARNDLTILSPLTIYSAGDLYSKEIKRIYAAYNYNCRPDRGRKD